jgi:hypothetical protein
MGLSQVLEDRQDQQHDVLGTRRSSLGGDGGRMPRAFAASTSMRSYPTGIWISFRLDAWAICSAVIDGDDEISLGELGADLIGVSWRSAGRSQPSAPRSG